MRHFLLKIASVLAGILPQSLIRKLYNIKPLAGLIRRMMNLAAPEKPEVVRIAGGEVKDLFMELNLQIEKDLWLGTYEIEIQHALAESMQPGMVAYDVGANIGYMSLLLARLAGAQGHVFSFEALPGNVQRLKANTALNMCVSAINIIHAAVVNQPGEVSFFVHPSTSMGKAQGSAGREEEYVEEIKVPAVSLDDFVFEQGNPPPDLVKMDIEGGEVMAFPGMRRVLQEHHPIMFIEIHGQEAAEVCWHTLTEAGYSIYLLPEKEKVLQLEQLDWKAYVLARKE